MKSNRNKMRFFSPGEFGAWWPFMSTDLLSRLDMFRAAYGDVVLISPAAGALGRELAKTQASQHNILRWGEVRAADIMPVKSLLDGTYRALTVTELSRAFQIALRVGFSGVGIYTGWQPFGGLHVDVRAGRSPGDGPATWAGVRNAAGQQVYVSAGDVLTGVRV